MRTSHLLEGRDVAEVTRELDHLDPDLDVYTVSPEFPARPVNPLTDTHQLPRPCTGDRNWGPWMDPWNLHARTM